TIKIFTKKHLLQLKSEGEETKEDYLYNVIFICFDKNIINEINEIFQESSSIQIIDCSKSDRIHTAIFKIIKLLAPNINLKSQINDFNIQQNNLCNPKVGLMQKLTGGLEETKRKMDKVKIMAITLILIVAIGVILLMASIVYNRYGRDESLANISINFLLPNK